ncbi:MAG TPA: 16S rRNA (adenine(1518)-N(6)/adenine(1519)-N(6))-dimethyltransferase RsmA [Opitutaceae bacterium]|nr:16S rRNA (adenine(1518)-N(6)/adenine(1519)-N(6))-dimethyltransferase RsmA [Opitutaceae bacterium]
MPLSPTATRDLLARLGHQPKRFLGQNFLVDGNIVRKSLELAGVSSGDAVVEVGPGLGTLTSALLEAGAEVWAVEKDRALHAHLAAELVPHFPHAFHLIEADAVQHPLADLPARRAAAGFKIVANLPYAIATPWLDAVLSGPLPERMVLMLQQEAAQRYAAAPGSKSFGAISVFLQAAYAVAPGHKVAAACFFPRPDIESHLLNLQRKPAPFVFPPAAKNVIRACFQQRRKQIGALLRARLPADEPQWRELLRDAPLSEKTRPEALPVDWWVRFSALLPPLA